LDTRNKNLLKHFEQAINVRRIPEYREGVSNPLCPIYTNFFD